MRTWILTAAFSLLASTALAQDSRAIQVEAFEPTATPEHDVLHIQGSKVIPHQRVSGGLMVHFVDDALQIRSVVDETAAQVLDEQYKLDLGASVGLFDILDVSLVLPMTAFQTSEPAAFNGIDQSEITSFAFSDLRVVPKVQLAQIAGFGFALSGHLYIPIGDDNAFHSDGAFRAEPRAIADVRLGDWLVAANVGMQFRPETFVQDFVSDHTLRYGVGAEWAFTSELAAMANTYGSVNFRDGRDPRDLSREIPSAVGKPIEWVAGLKWKPEIGPEKKQGPILQLGGGGTINSGIGSPDFRIFAGFHFAPSIDDPSVVFATSEDGTVIVDLDGDGVAGDKCEEEPEDFDGFQDDDGCPDPDNDQDGIQDVRDLCPQVPGVPERDGCPILDADGDKIEDADDVCPQEAEDFDQFEDEDGCPELDNDKDGIPDKDDKCPLEPETINGVDDDDGCPDKGDSKVSVGTASIEILEAVFFETGKAEIKEQSFDVLNQVASALKANPRIAKLRVEGHTDTRGKLEDNLDLSNRRAEAVKNYLIEQGIEALRLESIGFGETRPIADNRNKRGRQFNRRVEFRIREVAREE